MKYSILLSAIAALQPAVYAQPVGPEVPAKANTDADSGACPQSFAEAGGVGVGVSNRKDGVAVAGSWVALSAGEVSDVVVKNVQSIGVSQEIIEKISQSSQQTTENLDGRNISSSDDVARVIGTVGKTAADATADNNATQITAVMSSIKGVVESTIGNSTASGVVIGACAIAAASGEDLEIVIKVATAVLNAVNETAPSGNGTKAPSSNLAKSTSESCKNDVCRTGVYATISLANLGINHDVTATLMVGIEAIGKYKNVSVKIVQVFAELTVEKIKTLGGNAGSREVADKVVEVTEELKRRNELPQEAAENVKNQAKEAAEKSQNIPNKDVPTPGSNGPEGPAGSNGSDISKGLSPEAPKSPEGASCPEQPRGQ